MKKRSLETSVTLNENKYGVHINLSELKKEILDELFTYIKYVNTQESTLDQMEKQKEDYKNTYFTNNIKDNFQKYGLYRHLMKFSILEIQSQIKEYDEEILALYSISFD